MTHEPLLCQLPTGRCLEPQIRSFTSRFNFLIVTSNTIAMQLHFFKLETTLLAVHTPASQSTTATIHHIEYRLGCNLHLQNLKFPISKNRCHIWFNWNPRVPNIPFQFSFHLHAGAQNRRSTTAWTVTCHEAISEPMFVHVGNCIASCKKEWFPQAHFAKNREIFTFENTWYSCWMHSSSVTRVHWVSPKNIGASFQKVLQGQHEFLKMVGKHKVRRMHQWIKTMSPQMTLLIVNKGGTFKERIFKYLLKAAEASKPSREFSEEYACFVAASTHLRATRPNNCPATNCIRLGKRPHTLCWWTLVATPLAVVCRLTMRFSY